ncbi:hypothetical protein SMQE20_44900 [Serratia marcescens]|nr:hypothetical protein SMQE20_44900 [Serratia marcescens]
MSLIHLVVVQYLYQNMATASTHMRLSRVNIIRLRILV